MAKNRGMGILPMICAFQQAVALHHGQDAHATMNSATFGISWQERLKLKNLSSLVKFVAASQCQWMIGKGKS